MAKKLKLSNPGDVIESNFYIDEAADKYYIEDKIDAKPVIDRNKELQKHDINKHKDFKYVASIPLTIFYNMQKTGIISKTGKVQDRVAFARFLNDPDNKYLKVTDKKI